MSWAAVIAALLQVLGPVIADFLKQLLDKWLSRAAETLPAPAGPADVGRLFDAAIERTPRFAFARRSLLRAAKRVAESRAAEVFATAGAAPLAPLTTAEAAELADAAGAADTELVGW